MCKAHIVGVNPPVPTTELTFFVQFACLYVVGREGWIRTTVNKNVGGFFVRTFAA